MRPCADDSTARTCKDVVKLTRGSPGRERRHGLGWLRRVARGRRLRRARARPCHERLQLRGVRARVQVAREYHRSAEARHQPSQPRGLPRSRRRSHVQVRADHPDGCAGSRGAGCLLARIAGRYRRRYRERARWCYHPCYHPCYHRAPGLEATPPPKADAARFQHRVPREKHVPEPVRPYADGGTPDELHAQRLGQQRPLIEAPPEPRVLHLVQYDDVGVLIGEESRDAPEIHAVVHPPPAPDVVRADGEGAGPSAVSRLMRDGDPAPPYAPRL